MANAQMIFKVVQAHVQAIHPEVAVVTFEQIKDRTKSRDGKSFGARFLSGVARFQNPFYGPVKRAYVIQMKDSWAAKSTSVVLDLMLHEFAHAVVRLSFNNLEEKHGELWENTFKELGGSGLKSEACSD